MLAAWALFKTFSIGWRIGIVLAIVGLIAGTIWYVHHSIYTSGYRAAEQKLKPQIDRLTEQLKQSQADLDTAAATNKTLAGEINRLGTIVRDQNLRVTEMQAKTIEAQNQARDALARVAANQKRYSAEIARLQAIVNGPPMTEGDCEEADSIMRSILRDRMSISTGAEAGGDRSAAQDRGGEGAGSPTVHHQSGSADTTAANQDRFEEGGQATGGGGRGARSAQPG